MKKRLIPLRRIPFIKNRRRAFILAMILFFIIIILFGAKITLYFNFLLGNDLVIKLKANPEWFSASHGERKTITAEAKITTNFFCKADCSFLFEDISRGAVIDEDNFTLLPSVPLRREYIVLAPEKGEGINVYQFSLACHNIKTFLCHTKEEQVTRNILVMEIYGATEEEKAFQGLARAQIEDLSSRASRLISYEKVWENASRQLQASFNESSPGSQLESYAAVLESAQRNLTKMETLWAEQEYPALKGNIEQLEEAINSLENQNLVLNSTFLALASSGNFIRESMAENYWILNSFSRESSPVLVINQSMAQEAGRLVNLFHETALIIGQEKPLYLKESLVSNFSRQTKAFFNASQEEQKKDVLQREILLDINYAVVCSLTGNCLTRPPITERAQQAEFELNVSCREVRDFQEFIMNANDSLAEKFAGENYSLTEMFWENARRRLLDLKQGIASEYLGQMPLNDSRYLNDSNGAIILPLLAGESNLAEESIIEDSMEYNYNLTNYNLTPALIALLAGNSLPLCEPFVVEKPLNINVSGIAIPPPSADNFTIALKDQLPQCCVFGKCQNCCREAECRNDPATYPVVFLHGHAVSKDTSFEYSLEGFNKIQQELEEEGYLNAGAITLYTSRDVPAGIWGELGVPVTIRASYYFDLFEEPENYVVVQTKSENIDTYAVRLREVIETIRFKTGRDKINLVAFSMGGLVARRYIQIFGAENVNTLVLIGTPNHGIKGDTAELCPLVGEQRECRDMNADSLFMNKLNRGSLPNITVYNIVGTGCGMDSGRGDGAVLEESAFLEGAENTIISGKCRSKTEPLHLELRDIDQYPEVYEIVRKALSYSGGH